MQSSPSVDVVWWTDTKFYIRCPYCDELHGHGFVSYESASRKPHCASLRQSPEYQYHFPTAYEIDKAKARFVNTRTLEYLLEDESDDTASLACELSNMALSNMPGGVSFDDSKETTIIQFEDGDTFETRAISLAISDCVNGQVRRVEHYLTTSPDKSIFLHGNDSTSGNTCLIKASQERKSAMVSLLLDHGAEVNATNKYGRTALMEASLWGGLETVNILLSRGANQHLCDNENRGAFDLAQPTPKNRKERHTKAGGVWGDPSVEPVHKEDVVNRDADRRAVARILGGGDKLHARTGLLPRESEPVDQYFKRSSNGQSIVRWGPIQEYDISTPCKTVAVLERGDPFPAIAAMSGWGHPEKPSTRVSGKDWTERVFKIAGIVQHGLSADNKDQGIRGRFQASHAEKQLIAYFLDRHIFLPGDTIPDPCFDEDIENLVNEIEETASRYPVIRRLHDLQNDKKKLERELFNNDDRLLGEEYDAGLVNRLKLEIASLNKKLAPLEKRSEVKALRAQERQIQECNHRKSVHGQLNCISKVEPKDTLTQATIIICSPKKKICKDCASFKDRVNHFFGISIKLYECTK